MLEGVAWAWLDEAWVWIPLGPALIDVLDVVPLSLSAISVNKKKTQPS